MQARDVMTAKPMTGKVSETVAAVMQTMFTQDIRHLPIVSGKELVGMISDRDLRQFSQALLDDAGKGRAQLSAPVGKMMTADVLTADPESDVDDLIDIMIENKVGAVPIVDVDGALVGIVSYIDILRAAAGKL